MQLHRIGKAYRYEIERYELSTDEAPVSYVAALGGKLEPITDIGGHLLKMPADPTAWRPPHVMTGVLPVGKSLMRMRIVAADS